jgi:hypothetical protein
LTNPPVDQNGSWEAILAPKLNRPAWYCGSAAGAAPFDETPGLADFSNLGKVINDPQLVLIHPATALDEHDGEPIRSLHLFSSSSMN